MFFVVVVVVVFFFLKKKKGPKLRLHSSSTTGVNFLKVLFRLCLHFSRWTCGGPVNIGVNLRKRSTNPVAYLLIRHFRNKRGTGAEMHPAIDLIHNTRQLGTRSRTDGIKAMSRGFSGSKQEKKIANGRKRG